MAPATTLPGFVESQTRHDRGTKRFVKLGFTRKPVLGLGTHVGHRGFEVHEHLPRRLSDLGTHAWSFSGYVAAHREPCEASHGHRMHLGQGMTVHGSTLPYLSRIRVYLNPAT